MANTHPHAHATTLRRRAIDIMDAVRRAPKDQEGVATIHIDGKPLRVRPHHGAGGGHIEEGANVRQSLIVEAGMIVRRNTRIPSEVVAVSLRGPTYEPLEYQS